jgi:hypothetical protein
MPAEFVAIAVPGHRDLRRMTNEKDDPVDLIPQTLKFVNGAVADEFPAKHYSGRILRYDRYPMRHYIKDIDPAVFIGDADRLIKKINKRCIAIDFN